MSKRKQLKHHDTLPNLLQDDLGSPDSNDGLVLSPQNPPADIADPQISMLSEAIKSTLTSSFTGLQSTLTDISAQMERIASRPSSFHAHRADDRISIRTPTSTHTRVSPRHHRAATSADASPAPSRQSRGGGLPGQRGNVSQEDEDSDAISLHPAEDIPITILPQESKFRVFQNIINKTSEELASPLLEDMASCFNAAYHRTSLAKTSEVKELIKNTLRPANIDMIVRTTNNGLFSLKDPAGWIAPNLYHVPSVTSRNYIFKFRLEIKFLLFSSRLYMFTIDTTHLCPHSVKKC